MTVRELIELLQTYEAELPVLIESEPGEYPPRHIRLLVSPIKVRTRAWYREQVALARRSALGAIADGGELGAVVLCA